MKSKLILGLSGLLVLGACTNDEVVDVKEKGTIDFRPLVEASTRAVETTAANISSFGVTALNGTAQWGVMTVTKGSSGWSASPKTFWPNTATQQLDFYAYAPTSTAGVTISGTEKKITGYTPSATVTDQQDLVIAYNTGTMQTNATTGVPMYFKHALSQIEVKAKCSSSNMKVEIIGVKIAQAVSSGDFTYPSAVTQGGVGNELARTLWTAGSNKVSYMVQGASAVTLTDAAQSVMPTASGNFMLIPQSITAWNNKNNTETNRGSYISVLCRISNVSGGVETQIFPTAVGKYGFSAVAIGTTEKDKTWEPGKKYIYTLEFFGTNSGGGKLDPDPTVPTGGGGDENVDPTDPTHGGADILKPITFTVDVEGWTPLPVDLSM